MAATARKLLLIALLVKSAHSNPVQAGERPVLPLGRNLLQARQTEPLHLPSAQELEALRRVAQLLAMLGEQVLPSIVSGGATTPSPSLTGVPSDAVMMHR